MSDQTPRYTGESLDIRDLVGLHGDDDHDGEQSCEHYTFGPGPEFPQSDNANQIDDPSLPDLCSASNSGPGNDVATLDFRTSRSHGKSRHPRVFGGYGVGTDREHNRGRPKQLPEGGESVKMPEGKHHNRYQSKDDSGEGKEGKGKGNKKREGENVSNGK